MPFDSDAKVELEEEDKNTGTTYKIAENMTQYGEKIYNMNEVSGSHFGDVYHGDVVKQHHSGSGDNVKGDKNVTNN